MPGSRTLTLLPLAVMTLAGCASIVLRPTEHRLGRGLLLARSVTLDRTPALITVTRTGYRGGEVRTTGRFDAGRYRARLRCDVPRGALCGFFLYQPGVGDDADEIDIELIGGTRRVLYTTWVAGRRTNHVKATLDFDPATGFHDYAIDRRPGRVAFVVDGREEVAFTAGLPEAAMPLWINAWWPEWLEPGERETGTLYIEEVGWSR